ncbi:MAG: hypothetical protein HYZ57_05245 [Acidobacteria bacterium]|nr:hypothetical protein [Acidobacteriota bacterium]
MRSPHLPIRGAGPARAWIVAMLAGAAMTAFGAELQGTWTASSNTGARLAGTWTVKTDQESGSAAGTWTLREASGRIAAGGTWSAAKSPKAWSGAWRATVAGRAAEYSGSWAATPALAPEARLADMFEAALEAVVAGTWKTGRYSGSWAIRASP